VAASAAEIDSASETLRTGAGESRALAEDVAVRAAIGRSSMQEALGGMLRIREAVDTAVQRFDRLGVELGRVDRVTQVIDDIAGRTNLLSLNAAIIAAQAGEHGRAFGVVASEIRGLAEKTAASTREIRAIVEGVAAGGEEAAEAIAEGVLRVVKGEEMVTKTGSLLEAIHSSADHTAQRLREIDAVAEKQASQAARVADEIRQVSQGVVDIVSEIRAEEERTREIRQNLAQMAEMARHTVRAADEQSQGTEFITRTVTAVSLAAEQVDGALDKVGGLLSGLRSDLEVMDTRARAELDLVARLAEDGAGLAALSGGLHREVDTFRLPAGS
jgi:methyl-accepting chemotaxis protein